MTISELVKRLEEIKENVGDIECCAWDANAGEDMPITGMSYGTVYLFVETDEV